MAIEQAKTELFVALDLDSAAEALRIAEQLGAPSTKPNPIGFKVGPRLLYKEGESLVKSLSRFGPVFVDCKFLDIPSTMEASVRAAFDAGASVSTIHALAGPQALSQMAELEASLNRQRRFQILTVTVLTSFSQETLPAPLCGQPIATITRDLVAESVRSGLRSFVCSASELPTLKKLELEFNTHLNFVTPGIRPSGSGQGDQVRVETPESAGRLGATALVVGRPILEASDRAQMAAHIINEFRNGRRQLTT